MRGVRGKTHAAGSGLMPADQAVAQVLHRAHGSAFCGPPLAQWAPERGAAQADDFGWAAGAPAGARARYADPMPRCHSTARRPER